MRFHVSRRSAGLAAGLLMAAVLPACGGGGGNNNNPTPVPTPTPRTTTSVYNQSFSVGAGSNNAPFIGVQDVNIPNTGDVVVSFDWTFSSSDIDLVVSSISCTDGTAAYLGSCTVFGSDKGFTKPARVNITVTSPGFIRIWVYNFATIGESGVMSVTLTR